MRNLVSFLSGLIFSLGLGLGGMLDRSKVQGFLDVFGAWDPSLAFVMGGSVMVYSLAYFLFAKKRSKPILSPRFWLPENNNITKRLIVGSSLFGMGWGLIGYCPGPAVVSLASTQLDPWIFVASMLTGMWFVKVWDKSCERQTLRKTQQTQITQ